MYVSSPCTPDSPLYALAHCFYNGYRLHHFRKAGRLPLVLRGRIGFAYRYDSHNRIHGRFVTEVTRRHGPDASCRTSNCSPTTFRPVNEISLAWRTVTTKPVLRSPPRLQRSRAILATAWPRTCRADNGTRLAGYHSHLHPGH